MASLKLTFDGTKRWRSGDTSRSHCFYDPATSRLYLTLANAGKVGQYDQPPLIVVYDVAP